MKNLFLVLIFATGMHLAASAQQAKTLKKIIELEMPEGQGSNGAAVAWHPIQKKYYASFAGNAIYPMAVFDPKGKRLSKDVLEAGFDVRGIWYNTVSKKLQGNGYNDFGWTNFKLDNTGIPTGNEVFVKEMSQPNEQSVGVFDGIKKLVYFLSDNKIVSYDLNGMEKTETTLTFEENEEASEDDETALPEKFNTTSVIFTGIPKAEWGLLDVENKEIVLFNSATGKPTTKWTIDSAIDFSTFFGFAYANGIVFIFNKEERKWVGYK